MTCRFSPKLSDEEVEEKNGMVTLIVTIEEELLRRVDASLQTDLAAEGVAKVEEGLHFNTHNEPGELSHVMEYQSLV